MKYITYTGIYIQVCETQYRFFVADLGKYTWNKYISYKTSPELNISEYLSDTKEDGSWRIREADKLAVVILNVAV